MSASRPSAKAPSSNRRSAKAASKAPSLEPTPDLALEEAIAAWVDRPTTAKERLQSVGLWGAGMSFMGGALSSMAALGSVLPADGMEWFNRAYCRFQVAIAGAKWRCVVHPDVDPDVPYMFCQNHTNHFDHVALYDATPHFKQGLELEAHFKYPVYGWFMKSRGTIPVRSGSQGQTPEIMENMHREVAANHSILAFPEGTRTTTGRVGKFRKGVFFIARDLGIPVVPVAVTGMYEVMHKGSRLMRAGQLVTVHVDRPIPMAGLDDAGVAKAAAQCRSVVSGHVDAYWRHRLGAAATVVSRG